MFAHLAGYLVGQPQTGVVHGQQKAFDLQLGIQLRLGHADRVEQLAETFQREILALDRDQYAVGRDQRVERNESERRGAVDQNEVVTLAQRGEQVSHPLLSVLDFEQFGFGSDQIDARR